MRQRYLLVTIFFLFACSNLPEKKDLTAWKHFSIDESLPGERYGTGGPTLADYDGDGDLDLALSRKVVQGAYWYEYRNDSTWIRHFIGNHTGLENTLGTTALDIDQDGWTDIVFSRVWFRNPGNLMENPDTPWSPVDYPGRGHDIITLDVDGNGIEDIMAYNGKKLSWFNVSNELEEFVISDGHDDHGGLAPRGAADIDADGDVDAIIPGFWFANPGKGIGEWEQVEWPFTPVPKASYGRSTRSWIEDLDNDGDKDIIYSHCDTGNGHVYWIENKEGGKEWISHLLPDPPTKEGDVPGTGSFHSLGLADFDLDGDLDIFAGEQEDPDVYMVDRGLIAMKPVGLKERGVIWENNGAQTPEFMPVVIQVDNPGWHDASLADIDGDGDIDIVTKIWNADGPNYHADYWRNDINQ
ncbi:FG-GAP repeat domain-containing protein [Bacteroidota bacterium]